MNGSGLEYTNDYYLLLINIKKFYFIDITTNYDFSDKQILSYFKFLTWIIL